MTGPTSPRSSLGTLVGRYPAVSFFALTLALSWGVWVPAFLALPETPLRQLVAIPGAFGPGVAAAIVTRLRGESVRAWLADAVAWRRPLRWYVAALGVPVVLSAGVGAVLVLQIGSIDESALRAALVAYPFTLAFATLLGGGQEEFGWRGFGLPHLQARVDAFTASVVVGLVWALWHAPLFAFDVAGYAALSPLPYAVSVVGFSVVFTWYYNGSRGCLPGAVLLHGSVNAAVNVPPAVVGGPDVITGSVMVVIAAAFWLLALGLLVRYGRESLARSARVLPTWERDAGDAGGADGPAGLAPEVSD